MPAAKDPTILVVGDQKTMLAIERNMLRQIGLSQVDLAQDALEALQQAKKKKYDLIMSDWSMAQMSGLELLERVRNEKGIRKTPFIVVATSSNQKKKRSGTASWGRRLYRQAFQFRHVEREDFSCA